MEKADSYSYMGYNIPMVLNPDIRRNMEIAVSSELMAAPADINIPERSMAKITKSNKSPPLRIRHNIFKPY